MIPRHCDVEGRAIRGPEGVRGHGSRRYWKVDIERLKGRRIPDEQHESPPVSDEETRGLIGETKITLLTQRGLYYRGRDVAELAETETFESVAALLWEADPATVFGKRLPSAPPAYSKLCPSLAMLTVVA